MNTSISLERRKLELISPAKNLEFGIEAINHGADAVYIGGPMFSARAAAENTLADIEKLATHAHRFSAQVLMALNTILRDDELEQARRIAWQAYDAGVDALIVQDMGLLELDLPPIQLHASTQTDNRSLQKVKFLEEVGFAQIVLARELTLDQIKKIAAGTKARLEFFIHGALCVSYSGQCYLSYAQTGRSANRGECSQACRLPYSLEDQEGHIISRDQHLLSLKDNNQSANLRALVYAGISAFKIEGRLKDLSYVKNVTAHYRTLLDTLLAEAPEYQAASTGHCSYTFTPDPGKSFNRAATDYFVNQRQPDITSFASPKFAGEPIGHITRVGQGWFEVESSQPLHNGDGLSFYNQGSELHGLRINRVETRSKVSRLFTSERLAGLTPGMPVYRNHDQVFERLLQKPSAERRIPLSMRFRETPSGFALDLEDESGTTVTASLAATKEPARNTDIVESTLRDHLGKLGNTHFTATAIAIDIAAPWFIPVASLNALRRDAIEALETKRAAAYRRPAKWPALLPPPQYPESALTYLANVLNEKARAFYARHGVSLIEEAYECEQETNRVPLMVTKHCLRYSFNLCPKQVKGIRPAPMNLINGKERLTLVFDCNKCEMKVIGKLKKHWTIHQVQNEKHFL